MALLLNGGLGWALWRWSVRMRQLPQLGRWVLPSLGLKLAATALSVLLLSEDGKYFLRWAGRLTAQLWADPGAWLRMLPTDAFHWGHWHLVFHGFSNTLFLIKLLSVLNLASLGIPLLTGWYLSAFSVVASWEVVRQMQRRLPAASAGAAVVAFLLWPTVLYWTSGLTKESLLVGSGALVLAGTLRLAYGSAGPQWGWAVLGLLAAMFLHFKMRFFFAVVLFGAMAGVGLVRAVQQLGGARRRLTQVAVLIGLLTAGAWVASEVSPVFRLNKFTSQLQRNYTSLLSSSRGRPHLEYPRLQPTTESVVAHAPLAVMNSLVRPWPWEGGTLLYVVAGLENALLLVCLLWALYAWARNQPGQVPFALTVALLLYCLLLAALLGLTTPNLGTLNRYRVTFLPFLVLLLLQHPGAARLLRRLRLG